MALGIQVGILNQNPIKETSAGTVRPGMVLGLEYNQSPLSL